MWNYCYTLYSFVLQSFHTSTTLISPYSCLTKYIIHPTKYSHHFLEVSEPQRGEITISNLNRGACFPFLSLLPSLLLFFLPSPYFPIFSLSPLIKYILSSYSLPDMLNSGTDDSTALLVPFFFPAILFPLQKQKTIHDQATKQGEFVMKAKKTKPSCLHLADLLGNLFLSLLLNLRHLHAHRLFLRIAAFLSLFSFFYF